MNFFFLFCCCHSWIFLLVVLCCHSWEFILIVVPFLHSCEIFGVVLIFVVGGVTIWDGISKAAEEIKSGVLAVGVSECVNTINNACRDRERGDGTSFDVASCAEVEGPVGTLEVSCWSETYSRFCA